MASHIPEDLVAEITSHLRADKSTLRKCSTVSSRWLHYSRKQLFCELSVRSRGGTLRFQRFLSFIQSSPSIARCVMRLELSWSPESSLGVWDASGAIVISSTLIGTIARCLPSLQGIVLRGLQFCPNSITEPSGSLPMQLDNVTLHDVFASAASLSTTLSLFTIRDLSMLQCSERGATLSSIERQQMTSMRLCSLKLIGAETNAFAQSIQHLLRKNSLEQLEVGISNVEHILTVGGLVAKSVDSLRNITIDIRSLELYSAPGVSYWTTIHLAGCQHLTTLSLCMDVGRHAISSFAILTDLLTASKPHHVRIINCHLTIRFLACEESEESWIRRYMSREHCASLEACILDHVPVLERLVFEITPHFTGDRGLGLLREMLWSSMSEAMSQLVGSNVSRLNLSASVSSCTDDKVPHMSWASKIVPSVCSSVGLEDISPEQETKKRADVMQ